MAELSNLGRYQLRRILGKGAMGVVYDGYDPTIDRRVAIKIILKNHAIDEEMARDYSTRFVREARAAGRINHPNIVQVYDFGEQEDIAYLVMEFIQGRELRSFFIAKEKFEIKDSVRIMGELLDALDFAHEAGVIHRDVKPANVMLDSQRRVKLADFGVARIQDSERSAVDTMVGTPAFMSPEQISGKKIDRRTDIFSAGSILYQLLTGEQPFKGEGAWTVAKQIMQDDPPQPSRVTASVPPAFDELVNKALAKNPAQRFANAREFSDALRGILAGTSPLVMPASPAVPKQKPMAAPRGSDAEVEFWRSIQNGNDAEEFRVYLEEFPEGTYAQLARLKIAKLREPEKVARKSAEEEARQEAETKARRETEERAQREAEEQAQLKQAEKKARREAEAKARREAEEKARREAAEKAKRDADEKAKREAEARAQREIEEKARREAANKAKREADEKAKREAAEKVMQEAEEKIRQAQALARLRQQKEAAARTKAVVDGEATVAIGGERREVPPSGERKTSNALPMAAAVIVVIAVGIGAFLFLGRTPAPPPVARTPTPPRVETAVPTPAAPPKTEISSAEIEKTRKENEERIKREHVSKLAAEQAAAKAATEKAAQEKQQAVKIKAEKAAAEKVAAEKAAAAKAMQEKQFAAKVATEKAEAESLAAAEREAAEKAAAGKAAAEKAAAEKTIVAKTATVPAAPTTSASNIDMLLKQAAALEGEGKMPDAVRLYTQAARAGSGQAAKKLGDIYYTGAPGVSPNSAESALWHNLARARGVQVGPAGGR